MGARSLYNKAVKQNSDITMNDVKSWLETQPIAQVTKKPNKDDKKYAAHGHFLVTKPNFLHQMDIMFLPKDGHYKYALCLIDTATRYKAAQPLTNKSASSVAKALDKIYSTDENLQFPQQMNVDSGSEFKGDVKTLLEENNVKVNYSEPGHHRSQSMVERFNRTLAERLFKHMTDKEMKDNKQSNKWVSNLQSTVDALNDEVTRMIGMSPNDAMKLAAVTLKIPKSVDKVEYNVGDVVRYKLASDEFHDPSKSKFDKEGNAIKLAKKIERRRATDATYSLTIHKIVRKLINGDLPILYYISGKKHGYTASQFQLV
jgi:transposase InsO family protein